MCSAWLAFWVGVSVGIVIGMFLTAIFGANNGIR